MLKKAFFVFCLYALTLLPLSCSLFDRPEDIPAYIRINSFTLTTDYPNQGSASHKIVDAWIYVDNQLIGTFELPCTIPVLVPAGSHTVRVKPGVKMNGISALRLDYPFYTYHEASYTLTPGEITSIVPSVTYRTSAVFDWLEDFESVGHTFSDTVGAGLEQQGTDVFEGIRSGHVQLDADTFYCELKSLNAYSIPTDGRAVFLELNYKCTHSFNVGVLAVNNVEYRRSLIVNKSAGWNKIYINLTDQVNQQPQSSTYRIYFSMWKPGNLSSADYYFDNVKLIY